MSASEAFPRAGGRSGGPPGPTNAPAGSPASGRQASSGGTPTVVSPAVPAAGTGLRGPDRSDDTLQAARPAGPAQPPASTNARPASERPRTRRARLLLSRVDPWSVMKLSFLLSIALGIVLVTAVAVLWSVLDAIGVFESVRGSVSALTAGEGTSGVDVGSFVALDRVLGVATILAVVNIILVTALATLAAFLYNISTSLVGGLQVTLTEDA